MLKRVSIQNFKSLKDVTLDLQKVNLLIGPNNSGKTNFLKALEFFSGITQNVDNIDAFEAVSYKRHHANIEAEFVFQPDPNEFMAKNYNTSGYDYYHIKTEYEIVSQDFSTSINQKIEDWFTTSSDHKTNVKVEGGHRREFYNFLRTTTFRPDPSKLIQNSELSASEIYLNADCSNLISFYYFIDSFYKRSYANFIQRDLSKCIPDFSYFTLPPVKVASKSMLGLRFFDSSDTGFWADEVSEGVLYFLMILCIIHQPNPPKLLLLEEPEKGIHPRRIEEVISFIFGLVEEKDVQVIITTHSPIVVDMFKDMPESVFIFDKDDEGATHVKNLQKDIIEPEAAESERLGIDPPQYLNGLGQAWKVGLIGGVPQ